MRRLTQPDNGTEGELSAIFKRLYEDSVTGRISDERFTELSADYEAEQRELKEKTAALQTELSKAQEATVNAEKLWGLSASTRTLRNSRLPSYGSFLGK